MNLARPANLRIDSWDALVPRNCAGFPPDSSCCSSISPIEEISQMELEEFRVFGSRLLAMGIGNIDVSRVHVESNGRCFAIIKRQMPRNRRINGAAEASHFESNRTIKEEETRVCASSASSALRARKFYFTFPADRCTKNYLRARPPAQRHARRSFVTNSTFADRGTVYERVCRTFACSITLADHSGGFASSLCQGKHEEPF